MNDGWRASIMQVQKSTRDSNSNHAEFFPSKHHHIYMAKEGHHVKRSNGMKEADHSVVSIKKRGCHEHSIE